jgi:hypothetical protein
MVEKAELNSLFARGVSDYTSLSQEEKGQFSHLVYIGLRNYWGAEHLTREGLIPPSICEAYESAWQYVFQSPRMLGWLDESAPYLAREMREQIRNLVATPQSTEADRP